MKADFTPERITHLDSKEIFVFGSNLNGKHIGGAARIAYDSFGAKWGLGEGLSGNTYALPTLGHDMKCVPVDDLLESFKRFISVVQSYPEYTFYLTKVGCGIAGWSIEAVRKVFWESVGGLKKLPDNLVIPYEFYYERSQPRMRSRYGLYKLPTEVLLKNRSQEVGELKSYIHELEDENRELKKQRKETKSQLSPEEMHEISKAVKSEEMYGNLKHQNKQLREAIGKLRKDKNDLLYRIARNYIMKKDELKKRIEEEEQARVRLAVAALEAKTDEEREMIHNQIVDAESALDCLRDELKQYD